MQCGLSRKKTPYGQETAQVGTYACLKDHDTRGGTYNKKRFTWRQWVVPPCCVAIAADHVKSTDS